MALEYSCVDMPVVQEFFDSDAFFRGLMGPLGCLPADSEFLSPTGWKRMDAYQPGDLVCQWYPNGTTNFVAPSAYINEPSGPFIHFDSGSLKMALTPEHRVPHLNYLGHFQIKTAAEIAATTIRKTIPTVFACPAMGALDMTEDMIRFAVMVQADGHYVVAGHQSSIVVRKERKKVRVRLLLDRLGIEFKERVYEGRPTESQFVFYAPMYCKSFGPEWYAASEEQLRIILDEMPNWDGLYGHAEFRYFSRDKASADFIQYAAHAIGRRAAIHRTDYLRDDWKDGYAVNIRVSDNAKNRASVREHTKITWICGPDGRKYCFTVQSGFFVARHQDCVFITGNSGKSSACAVELGQRGVAQRPLIDGVRRSRWAVIRNTFRQLEDTTVRTFLQWFPPHQFGDWVPSRHEYIIRALRAPGDDRGAEIEIMFRALDRPDQIGNLLSLELTGAWVNEGREIDWPIIEALEGRVGRFPRRQDGGASWCGIWSDTNAPDVGSKWYKFFEEEDLTEHIETLAKVIPGLTVDEYRRLFKQPSGRSPHAENLPNLPQGYYQRLQIGKDPEWIKVYCDGEYGFVIDGKPVWPSYNDTIHCPAEKRMWPRPVQGMPIVRSWDFGLSPACVFSQLTPRGQWIVFDELIATSMGADKFSDEVLDHSSRNYPGYDFYDYGDPAGTQRAQSDEKTCFQILSAKGIMIEPGLQTLSIRLESVAKPLRTLVDGGYPQFALHPRCKMLRRAMMGGYHFRRMRISGERYSAEPDKNSYSHVADALGYAATRLFGTSLRTSQQDERAYERGRSSGGFMEQSRSKITGY